LTGKIAERLSTDAVAEPMEALTIARAFRAADRPVAAWKSLEAALAAGETAGAARNLRAELLAEAIVGPGVLCFPPMNWIRAVVEAYAEDFGIEVYWEEETVAGPPEASAKARVAAQFGVTPAEIFPDQEPAELPAHPPAPKWESREFDGGVHAGMLTFSASADLTDGSDAPPRQAVAALLLLTGPERHAVLIVHAGRGPEAAREVIGELAGRLVAAPGERPPSPPVPRLQFRSHVWRTREGGEQ
jgi:hypothetical protein